VSRAGALRAKTIAITGANTGIGAATARKLAAGGALVLMCCRDLDKANIVREEIRALGGRAETFELDLSDLSSVRRCAAQLSARAPSIDILINNAGVAGAKGTTRQGFEMTFGTNHLGHFLLTELLLPKLFAADSCRVLNVSSNAHYRCPGLDFDALTQPTRSSTGFPEYSVSKLANVLHAKELARRHAERGLLAVALHPGVVKSDVWRAVPQPFRALIKLFMISNEEGAETSLLLANSDATAVRNGGYYDTRKERAPSALASDPQLAAELWERSRGWSGLV
jgi:retinol dehydrogenase 12